MHRIVAACIFGLALLAGQFLNPQAARADLSATELALKQDGGAWEIHADRQGRLWVSDTEGGEIWRVDPNSGNTQVFRVGGQPTDAYPDTGDSVWWVDGTSLNRLVSSSGTVTTWNLPGGSSLISVEIDSQSKIWTNNGSGKKLFRFDPAAKELCSYTLSHNAQSYLASAGTQVWVGDASLAYLTRLDASRNEATWWELPSYTNLNDLSLDGSGNLWYSDAENNLFGGLGRLNPNTHQLAEFSLPSGGGSAMLAVSRGKIWYTEWSQGSFGSLDLSRIDASGYLVNHGTDPVTPECAGISPAKTAQVPGQNGVVHWGAASYPSLADGDGWAVYQLPGGAFPKGIAITESGWLVDQGRKVLSRFDVGIQPLGSNKVFLPAVRR